MPAKSSGTTHFRLDPAHPPTLTPDQAARLKAIPIDYSDIPELPDDFWTRHPPTARETKEQITLRLDRHVVEFFRAQGPHYQTRINAVLRTYVNEAPRLRAVTQARSRDQASAPKAAKSSKPAKDGQRRTRRSRGHPPARPSEPRR
jgi:uncharacterized protein (DUF4415 family)